MKLIMGKLTGSTVSNYWKLDDEVIEKFNLNYEEYFSNLIGQYAIVENMNDYSLVKIIGIAETTEENEVFIMGKKINKKVTNILGTKCVIGG